MSRTGNVGTEDMNGILIVDKDKGMTSHDVVHYVRKKFSVKKVGHAGTLDPNATGVLVLLLGKYTKMSGTFTGEEKEYVATVRLGQRTNSGDSDGDIIQEREIVSTQKKIKEELMFFKGEIDQIPPMVSAKKIKGKRLYSLARKGVEVERKSNKIFIREIEAEEIKIPFMNIKVICSKGTYIRQIADDLGERLGCGAHLTELRRTRSGDFSIDKALSLADIEKMNIKDLDENLIRI